jgi:hypothetical protein
MTGWDVLDRVISSFPPLVMALLLVAVLVAVVVFIVGFARHGTNFIKYGFTQNVMNELLEKLATKEDINRIDARLDNMDARFDSMDARLDNMDARFDSMDARLGGMDTRIAAIETNHFGHLKDFLTELTSILLDKGVINNQDKARLDNKLRGM